MTTKDLKNWQSALPYKDTTQPVLFIGHGSPMNAIQDNQFTKQWNQLGESLEPPVAILCISAHWLTNGTFVTNMEAPRTIHDFGGFPQQLFEVEYPVKGKPTLAEEIKHHITSTHVGLDEEWGLDHGAWSVIKHMYPKANIPVVQLSINYFKPPEYHYELAQQLLDLRKKGVLIVGSGNMVHNLRMVAWDKMEDTYGYDWALEINDIFKSKILDGNHQDLMNYQKLHKDIAKAVPTPDHYYPLLYTLGLQTKNDKIEFFNDQAVAGSLTMTSVKIG
ncbi:4,5-DOPA dioxygenase extradiol [Mangrovimonas sp. AS39]|uniref:4,5-DOPA-extradiol-dioxygenase n=1 Tax=Mangrovimonas futianensis TaxID=2895523 RepID=UPI001E56CBDC|nr:4,5-DOPA dioxygenase extradiol [Mangrovimonas futianensis]MCF1191548.1 4,5-DOPA dioxygenase extradiol [Mangrovimonas futianensis]MCF1195564.1 4,5-DOPA dioxygenase extradiol [Mangrovimonas futianensis]